MKKLVSVFLSVLMLVTLLSAFNLSAAAATEIKAASPAIPANVGEKVELSGYTVIFNRGETAEAEVTWKNSAGAEITEFTPDSKGVTVLTAEANGKKKSIYVVAKEKDEAEYILYEADFSVLNNIEALTADGWNIATPNAEIEDNSLILGEKSNTYARVFLPQWLGEFGDYSITADAKMLETTDSARWFAIAYRIQNENSKYFPYYHMCIRENTTTTNGIEFAERKTNDNWNVAATGYSDISSCKTAFNKFNVKAFGATIQYNVNGNEVAYVSGSFLGTKTEKPYYNGLIGLTMNFGRVAVSKITVALQVSEPTPAPKKLNLINNTHAENNLINAIANVQAVDNSYDDAFKSAEAKPSIALAKVSELADIKAFLQKSMEYSVIPTLEIADTAEAEAVITAIGAANCKDATVISASAEALSTVRSKNPNVRTGLIVKLEKNSLTSKEAGEIRKAVRSAPATFCVIENEFAAKQVVAELQELAVAVWVKAASNDTEILKALTSGANGIITDNSKKVTDTVNNYFEAGTMTRTPIIIGHRGNPSQAPENTLSGFIKAYENGADVFEVDVEITSDGEIIIMHDNTINRTTNYTGSKTVNQMTLAEIREYFILAKDGSVSQEKVPTLREVLEEFKDKDCRIFIEFKGSNAKNVAATAKIVKELDMEDRVDVISFSANFLNQTQKELPGMATGYLLSPGGTSGTAEDALDNLYAPLISAQGAFSTINPSNGVVSEYFIQAATDRGMTVWPWTYTVNSNNQAFLVCPDGVTTDDAQWVKNMIKSVSAENTELKTGATADLILQSLTYGGATASIDAEDMIVKVISGGEAITIENGKITANAPGTATVILGYKANTYLKKGSYVLYSQPITITVTEADQPVAADEEPNYTTIIIAIIAAVLLVAAAVAFVIVKKKKK